MENRLVPSEFRPGTYIDLDASTEDLQGRQSLIQENIARLSRDHETVTEELRLRRLGRIAIQDTLNFEEG